VKCEGTRTNLVRHGFITCLMVFRIVAGVIARVVTSMRMDRFFLRVEEKRLPLHGGRCWSPPTWPLRTCMGSSPGPTKNWPLPWSAEEDARGQCPRTAPHRHRGTSLSWQGRRTTPRKTDRDVVAGPPPCKTSP
jgi:hypothetical protein